MNYAWALAFVLMAPAAKADSVADFYRGKTLTIVVGSSPGGAYDAYGRLLARHIGQHIPGAPNVIVQDMPGAGSLTAARYLEVNAPTDGTAIVSFNPGLITQSIVSPETVKLKFSHLYWLGGITHEFRVCYAWHTTGVKTWKDLVAADHFVVGAAGIGTGAYLDGAVLRNLFGIKLKQIGGYPGSTEERLAIERGELDGACSEWNALPTDWIGSGKIHPFVRWLKETPAGFPSGVPYVVDLATSADDKTILSALAEPSEVGNPFAASRKVPRDRLETLRAAFAATMNDPDFLADAAHQQMPVEVTSGADAQKLVAAIYAAATPDMVEKTKNAMK
jgi:tripartite-type tricarboxylate transporter receptor subunit TctC